MLVVTNDGCIGVVEAIYTPDEFLSRLSEKERENTEDVWNVLYPEWKDSVVYLLKTSIRPTATFDQQKNLGQKILTIDLRNRFTVPDVVCTDLDVTDEQEEIILLQINSCG